MPLINADGIQLYVSLTPDDRQTLGFPQMSEYQKENIVVVQASYTMWCIKHTAPLFHTEEK